MGYFNMLESIFDLNIFGSAILWLICLLLIGLCLYLVEFILIKVSKIKLNLGKGSLKDVQRVMSKLDKR